MTKHDTIAFVYAQRCSDTWSKCQMTGWRFESVGDLEKLTKFMVPNSPIWHLIVWRSYCHGDDIPGQCFWTTLLNKCHLVYHHILYRSRWTAYTVWFKTFPMTKGWSKTQESSTNKEALYTWMMKTFSCWESHSRMYFHQDIHPPSSFPLTLGYATTFNSCQGLNLDHVGVNLTDPVFSHGQLYTTLSHIPDRTYAVIWMHHQENQKKT